MSEPFPTSPSDRVRAGRLLAVVIGNGFDSQKDLAGHLGVAPSGVSQWTGGERPTPLPALFAALACAAARAPHRVSLLVETFAAEVLGIRGTWVSSTAQPGASVPAELLDVHDRLAAIRARWASATADGRVDDNERREVSDALQEARREFEELEATIAHDLAARGR